MTEETNIRHHNDIPEAVLKRFVDEVKQIQFLGKRDHITFKVSAQEGTYLLKCYPGAASVASIESELHWLEALSGDTSLIVPRPLRTKDGTLVTEWTDEYGALHLVTMLHWVEGQELNRQPSSNEVRQLSRVMVQLHNHSIGWKIPNSFSRPDYDLDSLLLCLEKLGLLLDTPTLRHSDYTIIQETVRLIANNTNQLEKNQHTWGLIHSDLHESNYVVDPSGIRPIDFSCCGFGYFLFDIAETLLHLTPDNRMLFLQSYKEQGGEQDLNSRILDGFFLWQVIRGYAFHSTNPDEQEWLRQKLPAFVQNYCRKYLEGVSPIFV